MNKKKLSKHLFLNYFLFCIAMLVYVVLFAVVYTHTKNLYLIFAFLFGATILVSLYLKKIHDLEAALDEIENMRKSTLYELTKNAAVCECNKWSDKDKNHMYDEMWKFVHNYGRNPSDLFEIMAEVLRDREEDC